MEPYGSAAFLNPSRPQPRFLCHLLIFMGQFWVRRGFKMILSHRALTSLNMSSYRAIWTHFRPNFTFVGRTHLRSWSKIRDFPKIHISSSSHSHKYLTYIYIYMSRGSGQHQHLPPPPMGMPPPVDVGVGWAKVSPNNPNGTHGLLKRGLRTPTQLRPVLSTMGHLCLCCIHVVNSWWF